jgi:hypothetical protein
VFLALVVRSPTMGNIVRKSLWLWALLIVLAILVLGLIFGGYRKGTKLGAPGTLEPAAAWSAGPAA